MDSLFEASSPASQASLASSAGSELGSLLQVLTALVIVCGIAVVVLRGLSKRGIPGLSNGPVQIEQRLFLDAQNGLLVVRVEGRRLLLATHRNAPARLLAELDCGPRREANAPGNAPP